MEPVEPVAPEEMVTYYVHSSECGAPPRLAGFHVFGLDAAGDVCRAELHLSAAGAWGFRCAFRCIDGQWWSDFRSFDGRNIWRPLGHEEVAGLLAWFAFWRDTGEPAMRYRCYI